MESVRMIHHQKSRHRATKREALNADLVALHVRKRLEILSPLHEILHLSLIQTPVNLIQTFAAVMPRSTAISHDLNDPVLGVPLIIKRTAEPVIHLRRVRATVDVHVNRIFLGSVKILRIDNHRRKHKPVLGRHRNMLRQSVIRSVEILSGHIRHLE